MERSSNLDILMSKDNTHFIIRNFAIDPIFGYRREFGELIYVDKEDMLSHGFEIILENLAPFFDRDTRGDQARRSAERNKMLDDDYFLISLSLLEDQLNIEPMRRQEGGFVGIDNALVILDKECDNGQFYENLMICFGACKGK